MSFCTSPVNKQSVFRENMVITKIYMEEKKKHNEINFILPLRSSSNFRKGYWIYFTSSQSSNTIENCAGIIDYLVGQSSNTTVNCVQASLTDMEKISEEHLP